MTQVLEDSIKQILLRIQNLEASASNLRFKKILTIPIHYDKYDLTRAGRYIELPEWIKLKTGMYQHKKQRPKILQILYLIRNL